MSGVCPRPPASAGALRAAPAVLPIDTVLVRFHSPRFGALSFNPNVGPSGAPRDIDRPEDGARFSPFSDDLGANVPTLYAGTTEYAAALESVFHDVPHVPDPPFPNSKLGHFVLSHFSVVRPLSVLELVNSQLRQFPVAGRAHSLLEAEIVHSDPRQYPMTRRWAQYFYNGIPTLQGLAWRPRLGGEGISYVLFGDRVARSDLHSAGPPIPIDSGLGYSLMKQIAAAAHIDLVCTAS